MTTRTATSKSKAKLPVEVRIERYCIRFGRRAQAALCAQIAGACRLVWNLLLADCERRYRLHKEYGKGTALEGAVPVDKSVSFFTLGKRFTDIRSRPDAAWVQAFLGSPWGRRYRAMDLSWLRDLPFGSVRYTAKYLADHGADFDALDQYGRTPLEEAEFEAPTHTIELMRRLSAERTEGVR